MSTHFHSLACAVPLRQKVMQLPCAMVCNNSLAILVVFMMYNCSKSIALL